MYSAKWSPGLRQGDILGPIPLPLMGTTFGLVIQSNTLVAPNMGNETFSVTIPAQKVVVTVISHDCEFNENKRNRFLVARIQSLPGNVTEQQRADLRESNDVTARAVAKKPVAEVGSFLLAPVPGFIEDESIAVFTTITPLPMKMSEDLRGVKVAEMTQEHRVLFRQKVAWFFGRQADDVPDAEKEPAPAQAGSNVAGA